MIDFHCLISPGLIIHAFCDSNSFRFWNRISIIVMDVYVNIWGCTEIFLKSVPKGVQWNPVHTTTIRPWKFGCIDRVVLLIG